MNGTHIHLLLNHFPIIGALIGTILLLWGIIRKQENIRSAGAVIIVIMTLLAIPVFLTGETAEETVEGIAGISETMLEEHEDAGKLAFWIMIVTGIAAFSALIIARSRRQLAGTFYTVVLLISLVSFGFMARAGYLGGQIRHTELSDTALLNTGGGENNEEENKAGKDKEKEDDD